MHEQPLISFALACPVQRLSAKLSGHRYTAGSAYIGDSAGGQVGNSSKLLCFLNTQFCAV